MMDVFTRHARLTRDHWNAVCNDELPERMPFAEEVQREPDERPTISLRFGLALLVLSLSLIAVHSVWAVGL